MINIKGFSIKIYFVSLAIFSILIGTVIFQNISSNKKPDALVVDGLVALITDDELAAESSLIVEGTVSSISNSKWNTNDGKEPDNVTFRDSIYHDISIKVSSVIKGSTSTDEFLRVRVYNGEIPDGKTLKKLESKGYPEYSIGEKVILFLSYDDSQYNKSKANDYYVTTGMFQGKYTISEGKAINRKNSIESEKLLDIIKNHKDDPKKPKPTNNW